MFLCLKLASVVIRSRRSAVLNRGVGVGVEIVEQQRLLLF